MTRERATPLEPAAAAERVATLLRRVAPQLFADLVASGAIAAADEAAARAEVDAFTLFACVRGIVAASGFAPRTVETIDALHGQAFAAWGAAGHVGFDDDARRRLVAERYSEYETIAQAGGASGAHDVATRLGSALARHLGHPDPAADLAELLGGMHESLAEAVVIVLREEPDTDLAPVGIATPPLAGAWRIVARLERAGLTCALGGSGLLAALGLTDTVRDWDLTTDATRADIEAALTGLEWEHKGSDVLHADEKFMFPGLELEIIRGFSFFAPTGAVIRVPTIVTRRWAGLPVGSPECWAVAYYLLGREWKRDLLLGWLRANGANSDAVARLVSQPIPDALAEALRSLPAAPRQA